MHELETERLRLRPLTFADADFIVELLNEPSFLRYIGDKEVRDRAGACRYLETGPLASYARHGFGLLCVELKPAAGDTGSGTTGLGTTGPGTTGSGRAGSGTTGSGTTGSGAAGSGAADSGAADSGAADSGAADSGRAGSGRAGSGAPVPIGICGLIQRETLADVDLGFAFLPRYWSKGYAYEAAAAVLEEGRDAFSLKRVVAITSPDNEASIRLLGRLGFRFECVTRLTPDAPEVKLFAREQAARGEHSGRLR